MTVGSQALRERQSASSPAGPGSGGRRRGRCNAAAARRRCSRSATTPMPPSKSLPTTTASWGIAEIGKAIDFQRHGCGRATMAGKIHKTTLFAKRAWLRHLPDWTGLKTFWPHFVGPRHRQSRRLAPRGDHGRVRRGPGVRIVPATDLAPELLAGGGLLTGSPSPVASWRMSPLAGSSPRSSAASTSGPTVVIETALALEAIEGADECIRRAASRCLRRVGWSW